MSEALASVVAGLLVRGEVRQLLGEMKFRRECGDWFERRSLLESEFLIRGISVTGAARLKRWERFNAEVTT
jgi:hypothetical protein